MTISSSYSDVPSSGLSTEIPESHFYIESIPTVGTNQAEAGAESRAFFINSTAPNNVEDAFNENNDNVRYLKVTDIAQEIAKLPAPEILLVIHGYNTGIGEFSKPDHRGYGIKGWYESIYPKVRDNENLFLVGYRWPSEQINGLGEDGLLHKIWYGLNAMPLTLKVLAWAALGSITACLILASPLVNPPLTWGFVWVALLAIFLLFDFWWPGVVFDKVRVVKPVGFWSQVYTNPRVRSFLPCLAYPLIAATVFFLIAAAGQTKIVFLISFIVVFVLTVSLFLLSAVLTLLLLRVAGYFRDSYRATNYAVPDLVEFLRSLDSALAEVGKSPGTQLDLSRQRVKLSFIGHSMGGFVVTNTVRILSDVFDSPFIVEGDQPFNESRNSYIGRAFSLGRLVLASPDIPAESIISSRANFLKTCLRRFEEAYLFSNEGDMALRLASTAANYASFPTKIREGGYRLGNVVIRSADTDHTSGPPEYGIVNLGDFPKPDLSLSGQIFQYETLTMENLYRGKEMVERRYSKFLDYVYLLAKVPMTLRQLRVDYGVHNLDGSNRPIAELFTIFDCTDYQENDDQGKQVGLLTKQGLFRQRPVGKRHLNFVDYVLLCIRYFTGGVDTHGGYFAFPDAGSKPKSVQKLQLSERLIYGLATWGFEDFLLKQRYSDIHRQGATAYSKLEALGQCCRDRSIQVLLSPERYSQVILKQDQTGRDAYL